MKQLFKSICAILSAVLLVCNAMLGCSSAEDSLTSDGNTNTTDDRSSIQTMPPPKDRKIYEFWTLEELRAWLISTEEADAPALEEATQYGTRYYDFVQQLAQGNEPIWVPCLRDDVVSFRNEEGFANIAVFTSEWMKKPWIWYYGLIDDMRYIIMVSYLPTEEKEYASDHSAAEFFSHFYPTAPNVENRSEPEYSEYFDAIYEDAVLLSDRTVSVLYYDWVEGSYGDEINFVYDNLLVSIRAYGEFEFDKTWLEDLSFQPLT